MNPAMKQAGFYNRKYEKNIKNIRMQREIMDVYGYTDVAMYIPPDDVGKEGVIAYLVAILEALIKSDRKHTALKKLQGRIWQTRFQNIELEEVMFEDIPKALEKWHASAFKALSLGPKHHFILILLDLRLPFAFKSSSISFEFLCS
ncbi:hypothetical protein GIB67_014147 [Kingdonia uniflora]|uniref:Uncharacterized protein n=1 Tax=Kingdonia uniflora TaxID=39325 RepID=A0A7J7N470_9MAGN|nr:hypothetical protein GIB67_014147 [Kingdonia uniflora]